MAIWIDVKYANQLGPYLRNFKHKTSNLWNFSCPFCGDSKTNKLKARAYIYKAKTGLFVKCHNCGHGTNLGNLIKHVSPAVYQEYVLDNYKESGAPRSSHKDDAIPDIFRQVKELPVREERDAVLNGLTRLDKLPADHQARKYVEERLIPIRFYDILYFAPQFKHYVNSVIPDKFEHLDEDHSRLVIPFFNPFGKCIALQGRAFGDEQPKYLTLKFDENCERIYGLDRVDYARPIYIVEGPLDSLFLPNAIAVSGSSFNTPTIETLQTNATVIYDNEPRSPELCKLISRTIEKGFTICLWPDDVMEKDINEMVKAGRTVEEVLDIINNNTFQGIVAKLKFSAWRKC